MFGMFRDFWGRFRGIADTMEIAPRMEIAPEAPGAFMRALNMVLAASSLFAIGMLAGSAVVALIVLALALALMWAILVGILGIRIDLEPPEFMV